AQETWLVADSSKYGRTGFVNVLSLSEVDGIITDSKMDENALAAMKENALDLRVV
ncbi:MAG: DeoR/GlpR transcriptional regulator, partial [Spirochaetae bacterium HGW-Spirochaetae-9]